MKYFLAFLLLSMLATTPLQAQKRATKNRFNAGIVLGVTTSQINGDHLSGFDKPGFLGGVRAIARIGMNADLVVEMQYIKKGSRDPEQFVPGDKPHRLISLNYIEVPILYHQHVASKIGHISYEGGIAYARLIGFKINENANSVNYSTFTAIQDELKNDELALIMGGGIYFNEHIRVMGRFSVSLTHVYKNENPIVDTAGTIPSINELRNVQLAFGVNYIF